MRAISEIANWKIARSPVEKPVFSSLIRDWGYFHRSLDSNYIVLKVEQHGRVHSNSTAFYLRELCPIQLDLSQYWQKTLSSSRRMKHVVCSYISEILLIRILSSFNYGLISFVENFNLYFFILFNILIMNIV